MGLMIVDLLGLRVFVGRQGVDTVKLVAGEATQNELVSAGRDIIRKNNVKPGERGRVQTPIFFFLALKKKTGFWMPQKKKPLHTSVHSPVSGVRDLN